MPETVGTVKEELISELLPPPGDPKVGYKVFSILESIIKDKNNLGLPSKWIRNYELGKNRHWKIGSKNVTLISANLLYAHRHRTVNLLCDNNPTFNVRKAGNVAEGQEELYDILLRTAEYWWRDQEQQAVFERSVLNGETYGCAVEKVVFNRHLEYGLGEVEAHIVDPFHFGWYPTKGTDIQKAEAVLHYYPMSVREARRRWPDVAEQIKPDTDYLRELGDSRREMTGGRPGEPKGYLASIGGIVKSLLNPSQEGKGDDDETLVVEAWVKDFSTDRAGNDLYFGNIRCVTVCNAGRIVLSDRNNPSINPELPIEEAMKCFLFDKFPFIFTHSVTDNSNPWGMSDFEQLETLQVEVNKSLSQLTLYKDKAARLKFCNPQDSGVHDSELTNAPGIIHPTTSLQVQGLKWVEPPPIPQDLVQLLQTYKDYFFLVSGSFELESAQVPGREVIAYKAIAALLERAATMLKGKIRNYYKLIRDRGRMYISLAQNWYTEERWISYDQDGEEVTAAISGPILRIPAKLTVVSGSTMPVSRIQEREEAITLYDKGAIDSEALLEKLDFSNRKNILQRMRAGPVGAFLNALSETGVPDPILQFLQQIATMEPREVERAVEKGDIPMFAELMQSIMGQGQPTLPQDNRQALEEEKIRAEIELIRAKIESERVEQETKLISARAETAKVAGTLEAQRERKALPQRTTETTQ